MLREFIVRLATHHNPDMRLDVKARDEDHAREQVENLFVAGAIKEIKSVTLKPAAYKPEMEMK